VYFLLAAGESPEPPEALGMEASWAYKAAGAYIFSEEELTLSAAELASLLELGAEPERRMLAWLPGGGSPPQKVLMRRRSEKSGEVVRPVTGVALGNIALQIPSGVRVEVEEAGFCLEGSGLELQRQGKGNLDAEGAAAISLQAPGAGRLCFSAGWEPYELFVLFRDDTTSRADPRGGELRYFQEIGEDGGTRTVQMSYPLFEAVSSESHGSYLYLDVELDPLAPFDGERTRMRFQPGRDPVLKSEFATTAAGRPATLVPRTEGNRAGFYFGRRPGGPKEPGPNVYLAPLGAFELVGLEGEERLMCGTSGLEFLAAGAGDCLVFEPSRPALAPLAKSGKSQVGEPSEPLLESTYTTSWVSFAPGKGGGEPAYFGQPEASTNYALGVVPPWKETSMTRPAAVASRVRLLTTASEVFPMVLYGGALTPADTPGPPAKALMAFENAVLAPERGAQLRQPVPAPGVAATDEPTPPSPVFASADGKPLQGGTASTPQGFVVKLNPLEDKTKTSGAAGTWNEVLFARAEGIKREEEWLSLAAGSSGEVDPWLAASLTKDQLFLVLNDWSKLPDLSGVLNVGGFDFELAPKPEDPEARKSTMVFKYSTSQSLAELIRTPGAWQAKEHFVGGDGEVAEVQGRLLEALEIAEKAKGSPDDPFQHFRDVVADDPAWTGLIAFNGKVPGTGMPADLQMLYAGITGPLRAHHFGVELNRVDRTGASAAISESSLFGVIHYWGEPGPEPPSPSALPEFEYTLRELIVLISNSVVSDFHAKVFVRANRLFGREVTLERKKPPSEPLPPNTILLVGQYQRHGPVGTVTFSVPEAEGTEGEVFSFASSTSVRVLEAMRVEGASLVPVSSVSLGGGKETEITAQVTLNGSLTFNPKPVPAAPEIDLFTYGGAGLGLSGFGLRVKATLREDGSKGATEITPYLADVVLSDNRAAQRKEGLLRKLPLTLKGFLYDEKGLDVSSLGGLPVNVPEFAGPGGLTTATPTYALQFNLPMGTLGGLADAHGSIEATLLLGWGPSSYTPDEDAIGFFIQPPFLTAGAFGLELQGLLKTTFGDANLARAASEKGPTYVLLFNNIAISVLGMRFPPRVIVDFILFAGSGGSSNLGWSLAAVEPQGAKKGIEASG
jgi:hypothetical protein